MTLTKQELEDRAEGYFENYPNEHTFFATSDGMFFLSKNQVAAKQHARRAGKRIYMFSRQHIEQALFPTGEPQIAWKRDEIITYLNELGIEYDEKTTKKKLIATYQEWQEANANPDPATEQEEKNA